jgi:hypothetical protein
MFSLRLIGELDYPDCPLYHHIIVGMRGEHGFLFGSSPRGVAQNVNVLPMVVFRGLGRP